jgi:acetyl/propionyl-CoA carboxylase alpha subunit
MRDALNAFVIRGISSNIPFQAALMQHPRFLSGHLQHRLHRRGVSEGLRCLDGAARRSGAAGQDVKAGEKLAVIEAMKMENILKAEQDCKVKKISAAAGESLSVDQIIVEFE